MWTNTNDRVFYYRSYRRAPTKLVPSIISCQASCCLMTFGIFVLIAGCMLRFIAGNDSPPSKEFDTPFFNENRSDFSRTPRIIGAVMMVIGGLLIGGGLIAIIVAFIYYRDYEKTRNQTVNAAHSQTAINETITPSPIGDVHYPTQRYDRENPPDYQTATLTTPYYPSANTIKENY